MRVTVYLADDERLDIMEMPDADALDLRADFEEGASATMLFDMDGATIVVARRHVVRIDFETGSS